MAKDSLRAFLAEYPDGLIFFNHSGAILDCSSHNALRDFERLPQLKKIDEFFEIYSHFSKKKSSKLIQTLFQAGIKKAQTILDSLPQEGITYSKTGEQKIFQFIYHVTRNSNNRITQVCLIARDKTTEKKAIQDTENLREKMNRLSLALIDFQSFELAITEIRKLFKSLARRLETSEQAENPQFLRDVILLGELLILYEFRTCGYAVYNIEHLMEQEKLEGRVWHTTALKRILIILRKFEDHLIETYKMLYLDDCRNLEHLPRKAFQEATIHLQQFQNPSVESLLKQKESIPALSLFEKYRRYVAYLAEHNPQKKADLHFYLPSCNLNPTEALSIERALVQLITYSFENSIEPFEERLSLGKPISGLILLGLEKDEKGDLQIILEDDGAGLSTLQATIEREIINLGLEIESSIQKGEWERLIIRVPSSNLKKKGT